MAVYTWLTKGGAWRNPVGLTLIIKSLIIAGMFILAASSLFFRLSRLGILIATWADVALIGAVGPVMLWRTLVWLRMAKLGKLPRDDDDKTGADHGAA